MTRQRVPPKWLKGQAHSPCLKRDSTILEQSNTSATSFQEANPESCSIHPPTRTLLVCSAMPFATGVGRTQTPSSRGSYYNTRGNDTQCFRDRTMKAFKSSSSTPTKSSTHGQQRPDRNWPIPTSHAHKERDGLRPVVVTQAEVLFVCSQADSPVMTLGVLYVTQNHVNSNQSPFLCSPSARSTLSPGPRFPAILSPMYANAP
jgi:hypothetical protein